MATELFDNVDANDKVIGTTNKKEAHAKGYIHRVVVIYVFSPQGKLYVQQKNKLYDHSVGGHVMKDEAYDEAARREVYEELGVQQPLRFLGKLYSDETHRHSNYRHMYTVYRSTVTSDWSFTPNEEVKRIDAMNLQKVIELMNTKPDLFTAGFLHTMKLYLDVTKTNYKLNTRGAN